MLTSLMKSPRMLIDGQLVTGTSRLPVVNPATGEPFAEAPRADAELLDEAVAAAGRAFRGWAARPHGDRRDSLERLAAACEARFEDFARMLTLEQGKPLDQARYEVGGMIAGLRYFATLELTPHVIRDTPAERITEHRTPLGIVAAITPWNFPLILLVVKLAPALITGNVVIAKPAPTTPLTT